MYDWLGNLKRRSGYRGAILVLKTILKFSIQQYVKHFTEHTLKSHIKKH